MFKRSIILLFVAVLTLSLAACGKGDSDKSSDHKGKLEVKRLFIHLNHLRNKSVVNMLMLNQFIQTE